MNKKKTSKPKKKPSKPKKKTSKPKKKPNKRKKKSNKSFKTILVENKAFILALVFITVVFVWLVNLNRPITEIDSKGLRFLNKYEFPSYLIESGDCMRPYDVGDGVITFGPGITYSTTEEGIDAINQELKTEYSTVNNCIKVSDLQEMQKKILSKYENVVINIEKNYNVVFTQKQFNALVLLAYNSPNLFRNEQFVSVITDPNSNYNDYVLAANAYYQTLNGYDTKYGEGWNNRIKDSAEMYYYGDYRYQNN